MTPRATPSPRFTSERSLRYPRSPGGFTFEGYSCECKPAGATFSPAITISFSIPDDEWVEGKAYTIKCYNAATGLWETLETTVNAATHTVSAKVSHFSCFALFTESAAVTTATKAPVSATVVPTAAAATIPAASGDAEGSLPWMTILVVCIVVGVVAGGAYYLKKQ